MLDPSERVMSALRRSPSTRKISVTIPARTASAREVPYESANLKYSASTGGKDSRTVVKEFIRTLAAKTSRGLMGEVNT